MKTKIRSRDIKIFFLGLFAAFILSAIVNWKENIDDFKQGFNEAFHSEENQQTYN